MGLAHDLEKQQARKSSARGCCVLCLPASKFRSTQALVQLLIRWGPASLYASRPSRDPTRSAAQM